MSITLNAGIFKAYDVRGVYPGEVNEEAARAIGAAFVVYLGAKRIAVSRDMRLSSPTIADAFTTLQTEAIRYIGTGCRQVSCDVQAVCA